MARWSLSNDARAGDKPRRGGGRESSQGRSLCAGSRLWGGGENGVEGKRNLRARGQRGGQSAEQESAKAQDWGGHEDGVDAGRITDRPDGSQPDSRGRRE